MQTSKAQNIVVSSSVIVKKTRIEWIDVAKFFGIVLVFIAHGVWPEADNLAPGIIRGIIYSFHMPLFFILSMMTSSLSKSKEEYISKTKKRAIHLLIPYVIIFLLLTTIDLAYRKINPLDSIYWKDNILRLLGVEYANQLAIGPVWFLMALFIGQSIFDLAHLIFKKDTYLFVIAIILSTLGVIMGQINMKFPLTLDMVFSSMLFFFFGYKLKNFDFKKHQLIVFLVCLVLWLGLFFLTFTNFNEMTYYEVWCRRYPLYPLCYISAMCGSLVFMYLIRWFCKIKYIYKPFAFLGRWSIILLCVHDIDQEIFNQWFNFFPGDKYLNDFMGALIGLGIALGVIGLIYLYKLVIKPKLTKA